MSRSDQLKSQDWRAIIRLVGECRELGDDPHRWRRHCVEQLIRLVGADWGCCGEMADIRSGATRDLGVTYSGVENGPIESALGDLHASIEDDPTLYGAMLAYFERLAQEDGACLSRQEIIADRDWYRSTSYQVIHRSLGVDHVVWCFRTLGDGGSDDSSGLLLYREMGGRGYRARDRSILREANAALAPLVGGPLARFTEPSPTDLAPRVRQVLGCLLEGDGDKQIAARLGISVHTVNQYTKLIYQHFGVGGRAELLARWVRRRWGSRFAWID